MRRESKIQSLFNTRHIMVIRSDIPKLKDGRINLKGAVGRKGFESFIVKVGTQELVVRGALYTEDSLLIKMVFNKLSVLGSRLEVQVFTPQPEKTIPVLRAQLVQLGDIMPQYSISETGSVLTFYWDDGTVACMMIVVPLCDLLGFQTRPWTDALGQVLVELKVRAGDGTQVVLHEIFRGVTPKQYDDRVIHLNPFHADSTAQSPYALNGFPVLTCRSASALFEAEAALLEVTVYEELDLSSPLFISSALSEVRQLSWDMDFDSTSGFALVTENKHGSVELRFNQDSQSASKCYRLKNFGVSFTCEFQPQD